MDMNHNGNVQGQRTGAAGKGPGPLNKLLDKVEHKFGGDKFNNPDHDAKNQAMNEKIVKRIKKILPMVAFRVPIVGGFLGQACRKL